MTDRYDAIVVGAGHNGLVCATELARKGKSVLVLEANEAPGGAAANRRFGDGFEVSGCAHLLYQLQPAVAADAGLKLTSGGLDSIVLSADGKHLRVSGDRVEGADESDQDEYRTFRAQVDRYARLLNRVFVKPPPRLGSGRWRDNAALARLGLDVRRLGRDDMREFLRLIGMNIRDELVERFESPLLRGGIALDAVLGTHMGPRSPGSFMTLLHRHATGANYAVPPGGMGEVTGALAENATRCGVTIRTATKVSSIDVENGRVAGVTTEDGDRYDCLLVVSSADPKRTVMDLVGARHFETGFANRVRHLRARGNAAKLHLGLNALPAIPGLDAGALGQRLLIAPDEEYVERAFNPAKYGDHSAAPVLEIVFPTAANGNNGAGRRHVLSAVVQYAPCERREGWDDDARDAFEAAVLDTLEAHMPGIRGLVEASELLLPSDLEREYGMTGGHWHHAELSLDQFMFTRPVAGAAQYALPLDGLYLCGAGTHPGGGVSGAAGANAARAILRREEPGWR